MADEFECVYFCFTLDSMSLPDVVMTCMLLGLCSLLEQQFKLLMSVIPNVTYADMNSTLKPIFGGSIGVVSSSGLLGGDVKDDLRIHLWGCFSTSYRRC